MILKKVFYQIHQCLIEIFKIANKSFAGKSMLVVGDLYQLFPVNARPICAASIELEYPTSYVMKDLWELSCCFMIVICFTYHKPSLTDKNLNLVSHPQQ